MSGYNRQLNDEELRVRQGQAFVAADQQSAGANPGNTLLFNPAASGIRAIITKIVLCSSGATGVICFRLAVDPAFGAASTPSNRLFGGGNALACNFEGAVAATPANVGKVGQFQLNLNATNEIVAPSVIILPPGTGYLVNMGTNAINISSTWYWYEVPA